MRETTFLFRFFKVIDISSFKRKAFFAFITEKYQVYRYDLRGHGNSDHPKKQFDLEDHINDGIELIKQLKLEDFVLYGGSLGSYIAQGIAIRMPERINKLILNVSAAKNPASALAETAKKDNIPEKTSERREYWIKHLTHDPKNIASIEKSGFQKNTLDAEDEYRALKSITAFDFRDQLNKIDCPTLITSGIYDPVNPPAKGEILHKLIKNNQFSKFPSGHLLRLECAAQYKETVLDFLRK